jgi:hypothetical protein
MKKSLVILIAVVGAVVALARWDAQRPRQTPPGQRPLESLNSQNLPDFSNAFNGSRESVRLVLLLSPT